MTSRFRRDRELSFSTVQRIETNAEFPDPHTFDVMRGSAEQIAFGWGPHMCVGLHLARLEMNAIFHASATRVKRFHIQQEVRNLNNVLRGFSKLIVSVE